MSEYLSTFISLFGSISAITIAFLVLLYDSSKRKLDIAKTNVTNELENFLNCTHTKKLNLFLSDDNIYLQNKVLTDCQCGRIDEERVSKILEILNSSIVHFNSTNTNKSDADHLKKYHFDDITNELVLYNSNKDYFNKFPNKAKLTIGVPFIFTTFFIILAKYSCKIKCMIGENLFDYIIIIFVILGFFFIYDRAMKAIQDLNKINL
jgi:hypothetical protein